MALSPGHTPPDTPPETNSKPSIEPVSNSTKELLYLPLEVSADENSTSSRLPCKAISSTKSPRTQTKGKYRHEERSPLLANHQLSSQAVGKYSSSLSTPYKESLSEKLLPLAAAATSSKPPDRGMMENHSGISEKHKFRTRCSFQEEFVYFMDAKDRGNVGRFLNVSAECVC